MTRYKDRRDCYIRLDPSILTIVVVCDCGWRTTAQTTNEAWTAGANHQRRSEQGRNAIDALGKRRERGIA